MILFCVCLAHARQQGLGTPVATGVAFQKGYAVTGKVLSVTDGKPLDGATISVQGKQTKVLTNADGAFRIVTSDTSGILLVSFVGYQTAEINFNRREVGPFTIQLESNGTQLDEVQVSTGYQTLPKERATGSFVQIDNELLNRRVSANVLDRLDGVTSGLIFNKNPESRSDISIRGNSTIFANSSPLIVLDNYPYEGDINNINPNDIESISVLKDAAAASIWGVRAGNGVVVITTKKGSFNKKPTINFNANLTVGEKPNLYYLPQLSSSEFMEVEKFLFEKGSYWNIADGFSAISPVVALLQANKSGEVSDEVLKNELDLLGTQDVRRDLNRHVYRNAINQQYAFNINGGGEKNKYFISAGYDRNLHNTVSDADNRLTLNANNTTYLSNKLSLETGVLLTNSESRLNTGIYTNPSYPYEQLADGHGNSLAVVRDLRSSFVDTAGSGKFLDWRYFPLSEISPNQTNKLTDYRLNARLDYHIFEPLHVSFAYLYQKGITDFVKNNPVNSYFTRNLINTYSFIDPISGDAVSPIPYGDIVDKTNTSYSNNLGRLQLNFDKSFAENHSFTAIAGMEIREYRSFGDSHRIYGYNSSTANNANAAINFNEEYKQYYGWGSGRIPAGVSSAGTLDRNRSFYANASYSYKGRYTLSGSMRRDEANIFGVSANQKGVPLWSLGSAWNLSDEAFYGLKWLPILKFRSTFGYNGNSDKTTTAYLTVLSDIAVNPFGMNYLTIISPPNPSLRWEKVGVFNLGLDFATQRQIISGSLEYYQKNSRDLIANSPSSPQTGIAQFRGNAANMRTSGIDVQVNTLNLRGRFKWSTQVLYSYAKDVVTNYKLKQGSNQQIVMGNYTNPLEGYPLNALFGFPFHGLNSDGEPIGYLDGEESLDYRAITTNADPANLHYLGTSTPLHFGSLLNNFDYKGFQLSFNLVYKFDYFFRRSSINYGALPGNYRQADYGKRWQQPGDELLTIVPKMVYPADLYRDVFYTNSDALLEKGDHIRLQDVRFSYQFTRLATHRFPIQSLQIYCYANNLGVLWRANKQGLDPDSPSSIPAVRTIACGVKAHF